MKRQRHHAILNCFRSQNATTRTYISVQRGCHLKHAHPNWTKCIQRKDMSLREIIPRVRASRMVTFTAHSRLGFYWSRVRVYSFMNSAGAGCCWQSVFRVGCLILLTFFAEQRRTRKDHTLFSTVVTGEGKLIRNYNAVKGSGVKECSHVCFFQRWVFSLIYEERAAHCTRNLN